MNFVKDVLADDSKSGKISSKRLITLIFSVLLIAAFIGSLGWSRTVDSNLIDAAVIIVISGFGFTGVEKFATNRSSRRKKRYDDRMYDESDEDMHFDDPSYTR